MAADQGLRGPNLSESVSGMGSGRSLSSTGAAEDRAAPHPSPALQPQQLQTPSWFESQAPVPRPTPKNQRDPAGHFLLRVPPFPTSSTAWLSVQARRAEERDSSALEAGEAEPGPALVLHGPQESRTALRCCLCSQGRSVLGLPSRGRRARPQSRSLAKGATLPAPPGPQQKLHSPFHC